MNQPINKPMFKGVEMYIKPHSGELHFGFLPGTNRIKTPNEVMQCLTIKGETELMNYITRFPKGEMIFAGHFASLFNCIALPNDIKEKMDKYLQTKGISLISKN